MGQDKRIGLGLFLLALFAGLAAISLAKGGLFIARHEGDTLHLMSIVMMEARGWWPHLDFQSPIGLFASEPIALFVRQGLGFGHAFIAGQVLFAALILPAAWYVAASRLRGGWAYLFGGYVLVLALALVHGETVTGVSVSMHYNRWAWALAYLAILPAVLPPRDGGKPGRIDGVIIGLAITAVALVKITYFVAFAPALLIILVARSAWATLGAATVAGLVLAAAVTLWVGTPDFWLAYLEDLATVAATPLRAAPGLPIGEVIGAPAYLGGAVALILSVILLRQAGRQAGGLALFLLAPGFIYVQYQNWGNDPQWLVLLAVLVAALRPHETINNAFGWDLPRALEIVALAALAFATPSALNLAMSPFRHFSADAASYVPVVAGSGVNEDLKTAKIRARLVKVTEPLDGPGMPLEGAIAGSARHEPTVWKGETWPDCDVTLGDASFNTLLADELKASGLVAGKAIFVADVLQTPWLYGAGEPLRGGAPWFYKGLAGWENADLVMVPRCPKRTAVRKLILDAIDAAGTPLTEVQRTPLYVLYAK